MAIQEIRVDRTIYRFEGIAETEAERLQKEALTDPVIQKSQLNPTRGEDEIEIGYKPGVSDPVELSLQKAANLLGIYPVAASSARLYQVKEAPSPKGIEIVITQKPDTLIHESAPRPVENVAICALAEQALQNLSQTRSLFLNLEEMKVIQSYYQALGREPTDVEIEMIAQTWSEHCAHKTFKAILVDEERGEKEPLFTRIKNASQKHFERVGVVTAFNDNAGGMRFYDGWVVIGKGETHNSPVAIEPYAGALTKNGGLYRDIAGTGQGGENLVGFMINNFRPPDTANAEVYPGTLHPKILLLENSRGEREYGNPMGIPTHSVVLHVDEGFVKPTSLGVAIGRIPENRVEKRKPQKGDLIVAVGGKTGRDGIHGATFSSGDMTCDTQTIHSTAVQLGDPIVEKTMFDALIACRDRDLIRVITDCGAGGFSSAVGEMANGVGAEIWLDRVPTKYAGLASWEKWLSESQERMVVGVAEDNWEEFKRICTVYDTNADVIGIFTGDNQLRIYDNNQLVGEIDLAFLHGGLPQRQMEMRHVAFLPDTREPELPGDFRKAFIDVLSHLNICSKEEMHRQYDMTVQGITVMAPYVGVHLDIPSEASVLAPIPNTKYGLVTAHAINPVLNRIDPYWGSVWAFAHAATKYTAAGGDITQACGIDNYIAPSPDKKTLGDLDLMTDGLCDMIDTLGVPMVSGKDSLSSTYRKADGEVIKAPPSLNITIFGRIPDYEKTVTPDFKREGKKDSVICLVGRQDINAMGGSVYFDTRGIINSKVPKVSVDELSATLRGVLAGINSGKIKSAKAIGEGGLAVALAQMCFGGDCGADIEIAQLNANRPDFAIFNETAGCMLIEVETVVDAYELFVDTHFEILGKTTEERSIKISNNHYVFVNADIDELKEAWKRPIKEILNG